MAVNDDKDNVIAFPGDPSSGDRAALESAAFWIARINKGISDEDRVALGKWLQESDDNPRLLFELAEFWDDLDQLSELASLFPLNLELPKGRSRSIWAVAADWLRSVFR